jgi:hypothetical protein
MQQNLANGIVAFNSCLEIDQEFLLEWVDRRRENEPDDYTVDEDGNYINRGGYKFTPEQYRSAPGRFLNLLPEGVTQEDKEFVESLDAAIYDCLFEYLKIYPEAASSIWWRSPGHVATYRDGQHMGSHHDNGIEYTPGTTPENEHAIHNVITGSVILNNDYRGGQLTFSRGEISLRPPAGTVVLYPSNYIGAHAVVPVTEGTRYSYLQFFGQGTPLNIENAAEWFPNLLSDALFSN